GKRASRRVESTLPYALRRLRAHCKQASPSCAGGSTGARGDSSLARWFPLVCRLAPGHESHERRGRVACSRSVVLGLVWDDAAEHARGRRPRARVLSAHACVETFPPDVCRESCTGVQASPPYLEAVYLLCVRELG